jgi:hypothetical protein
MKAKISTPPAPKQVYPKVRKSNLFKSTDAQIKLLGRLKEFDARSRKYPIRALLGARRPERSYTWACNDHLDQGREGACVGFAWAHELIARPKEFFLGSQNAREIYHIAQTLDRWPGENYEGTSVIAGVKAVQKLFPQAIPEYRWGFDINDVVQTLGYFGPVVLGIPWYTGMIQPSADGSIYPSGNIEGGHAILATGYNRKTGKIRLHNSWGRGWGVNGDCFIYKSDLEFILKQDGEACIPVSRGVQKK